MKNRTSHSSLLAKVVQERGDGPNTHLRVVLICRALLNILAPMSSMLLPLRSTFLRQVLLPKALTSTVQRERRRDSVRVRVCRAWRVESQL